jgi:hypothetical protein
VTGAFLPNALAFHWACFAGLLILVAAAIVISAIPDRRNRLLQSRDASERAVRRLLEALAVASQFGNSALHMRANVMLLSSDGVQRRVDPRTAFNMGNDPDHDLAMRCDQGISGAAFVKQCVAIGDPNDPANDPAGVARAPLAKEAAAKVRRSIRSLMSAPIHDPDAIGANAVLLGTLQVDSDETLDKTCFGTPERYRLIEAFADAVAVLLKVGER